MNPAAKRFYKEYGVVADAIAKLDLDQEDRELVAEALTEVFRDRRDFQADLFRLLASDPLCLCAGHGEEPCPTGTWIRVAMHLRDSPDGRSLMWAPRKPIMRCPSCGAKAMQQRRTSESIA